ncbi:hypothetical protein [Pseudosporangium ferrugineum]|uniref:Uncharacterized protein n=1 Tax=Pseudosporangium ferrugineum TaxID=439699 RepID=A0A2T0RHE8_9ACTN|nr:hypothetical protein [Pseudosporangium ferrugineum]PRY20569.1 hypothetical protein CLV70_12337 [Pseudosporangium ferrugineum]
MPRLRKKQRAAVEPAAGQRRRFLPGVAALVGASGLLATVTGLVVTRGFDPIADQAKDVVGASPLVVYDDAGDPETLDGTAFAFDHVLPAAVLSGPSGSGAVSGRLIREGAVRVARGATAITIENARKETALITSIRAEVRKRTPAPSAALVVMGPSGGLAEGPIELHFDLDGVDLDARTLDKRGKPAGKFLDAHGVELAAGEKLRFNLVGHAAKDSVEWLVKVGYVVNGKARTLDLDPKRRPMRVTGASASYREAFIWDAAGLTREPLKKVCPTDCRRQPFAETPR